MENNTYHVFTHKDLDGAVSLLTFLWSHPNSNISYTEISNLETEKIKNYIDRTLSNHKIYVFDIPLKKEFLKDLDLSNVVYIDHHAATVELKNNLKNAKVISEEYTSNCLLVRKTFNSAILTTEQKKLILLADDYDSGILKYEESKDLNILFWTYYRNNFTQFIKDFKNGFNGFSNNQLQKLKEIKNSVEKEAKSLQKFLGELNIKNEKIKTVGTVVDSFNHLLFDYVVKQNPADLYFFINLKTNRVKIKSNKKSESFDLNKFADKFCNGSGNGTTASGEITPIFMELTKNLKPL